MIVAIVVALMVRFTLWLLTRTEKLFGTRALIVMLLIIGGIESHPGECLEFFYVIHYVSVSPE